MPAIVDAGDESPVELGLKFRSDVNGFVKRRALLQERRQHRDARRQPVDEHRHAAGDGDVHGGIGFRLAGSAVRRAGRGHCEHDLCGVLSHQRRPLFGVRRLLQQPGLRPLAAACAGQPPPSAATASSCYGASSVPDADLQRDQLLGRRRLRQHAGYDVADDRQTGRDARSTGRPPSSRGRPTRRRHSRVDYSTDGRSRRRRHISVSDAAFVTAHSVRLTGLRPSTAYFFRVRSTDRAGNEASKPRAAAPPPDPGGADAAAAAGLHDAEPDAARYDVGGLQRRLLDGHLCRGDAAMAKSRSHPARAREFSGSTMPAGWATQIWSGGGSATVAGGKLTVDGARVATCVDVGGACRGAVHTSVPGTTLEFVATFTGDPYQHSGLGQTLESSFEPFAPLQHELDRRSGHVPLGRVARRADLRRQQRRRGNQDQPRGGLPQCAAPLPHRLAAGSGRLLGRRCAGRPRTR